MSRSAGYDLPVTGRRPLQNGEQNGLVANITSALSSPSQLISAVQTQLVNGYEAVKDRVGQLFGHQSGSTGSPSRGITSGGTRFSRTSSQSSGSGSGGRAKGYNLRSRPVHSTPRDNDVDQPSQRKGTSKYRKDQNQHGEIDEEEEEEDENESYPRYLWRKYVQFYKKIYRTFINVFDNIWDKLKLLPLWLLIPLLLLVGLFACKFSSLTTPSPSHLSFCSSVAVGLYTIGTISSC